MSNEAQPQPTPEQIQQATEVRDKTVQNIVSSPEQALQLAEAAEKQITHDTEVLNKRVEALIQRAETFVNAAVQSALETYLKGTPGGTVEAAQKILSDRFRGVTITLVPGSNPPALQSTRINVTRPAPTTTPNAATNTPPANLNATLHAQFNTLDPTAKALVTRVMAANIPNADNIANQTNLIGALQALTPQRLNAFIQEINGLGNTPTPEQISTAVGRLGLTAEQGVILTTLAQHHRALLNAPAAGPQQAPAAPFSEDERRSLGAEVRRLDGLTGQGSVLQRAMGRLQLAFKGVDLAKLPNIERAEGMGKFVSIIVALVELVGALKNPTEDAAKKQAAERANMTPEERNRQEGIKTLTDNGASEQPPGSGIYVVTGDFGESFRPLQFAFEGGQWKWGSEGGTGRIPAGDQPYAFPAGLSPAQVALRTRWNQIGANLRKGNQVLEKGQIEAGGISIRTVETIRVDSSTESRNFGNNERQGTLDALRAPGTWKKVGDYEYIAKNGKVVSQKTDGSRCYLLIGSTQDNIAYVHQNGQYFNAETGQFSGISTENIKFGKHGYNPDKRIWEPRTEQQMKDFLARETEPQKADRYAFSLVRSFNRANGGNTVAINNESTASTMMTALQKALAAENFQSNCALEYDSGGLEATDTTGTVWSLGISDYDIIEVWDLTAPVRAVEIFLAADTSELDTTSKRSMEQIKSYIRADLPDAPR